jgi:hypothetical protein
MNEIQIILFAWLFIGFISALMAMPLGKGRGGCRPLMVRILLGPFGLFWAYAAKEDAATHEADANLQRGMKKRLFCADRNKN